MANRLSRPYRLALAALRGLAIFLISYGIGALTSLRVRALYLQKENADFAEVPRWAVGAIAVVALLLIFNSVSRLFQLYHRRRRDEYIALCPDQPPKLLSPLRDGEFLLEWCGIALLPLLLIGAHPFAETEFLLGIASWNTPWSSVLGTLPTLAAFLLLHLWQGYESRRSFYLLHTAGDLDRLDRPIVPIATALLILIGYPCAVPFAPYLLFSLYSVLRIFIGLGAALTLPVLLLALLVATVSPPLYRFLRIKQRRARFLTELRTLAEAHGYAYTPLCAPRDTLRHTDVPHFTLERDGRVFACSFLFRAYPRLPVIFTDRGEGYSLLRLGTKQRHVDVRLPFRYPSDTKNAVLILDPTPRRMLVTDGKSTRRLEVPDRIFNTVLYTPRTLLAAIDREHLGRFTSPIGE